MTVRLLYWFRAAFICAALGVLVLALLPDAKAIGSSYDKLNHIFAFFVLGVLVRLAWPETGAPYALALLLLFGVAIEVVQSFVGRDASVFDVAADVIGLALAVCATVIIRPRSAASRE